MPRELRPDEIERRERDSREPSDTAFTTAMRDRIARSRQSTGAPLSGRLVIDVGELDPRKATRDA